MDLISVALSLLLLLLLFLALRPSRPKGRLPPGPRGLPLLGSLLSIRSSDYVVFTRWRKEYGEVVYFSSGLQNMVLLNSYRALKAAYLDQGDIFSGRTDARYLRELAHHSGIVFNDGPAWKEQRRFVLHSLRDFGFGRAVSENIIDSECEGLLRTFDQVVGRPLAPRAIFLSTINNVIARLTFGERSGANDPEFPELTRHLDVIANQVKLTSFLPIIFPSILKIPPLLRFVERLSPLKAAIEFSHTIIRRKIDEHAKHLGPGIAEMDGSQANDLCDALLIERARLEQQEVKHSFTEWQVLRNLMELFLAGTETTSSTLVWAFFYLSANPDVQRRLQAELDREVGQGRRPTMKDRLNLHYACAVMDEVLRASSLAKTGVPHRTTADTELLGYHIPANMTVIANTYGIHHDPELWQRPNDFWPGHFLDDEGRYRASPHLSAFSIGKRACLGESLARMEIFLFLTGIMQSFNVRLADPNADVADIEEGLNTGNFRRPKPHEIILERRGTS